MSRAETPRTTTVAMNHLSFRAPLSLSLSFSSFTLRESVWKIFRGKYLSKQRRACFVHSARNNREIGILALSVRISAIAFKRDHMSSMLLHRSEGFSSPLRSSGGDLWPRETFVSRRLKPAPVRACARSRRAGRLQGRNSSSHFRGNGTAATMAVTVDSR